MSARCCHCRRPLGLCELTYEVPRDDGGVDEWCEDCDASLPPQLRPSVGYVPALLKSLHQPTHEQVPITGIAKEWTRWRNVVPRDKPAAERRTGPRSSRFAEQA